MHLLSGKRKRCDENEKKWREKERCGRKSKTGTRGTDYHVYRRGTCLGSHDVNQRTWLSRGRELFLGQVQRSIPRGMIDAPAARNGLRISPPRMRKLRDREKDS